MQIHGFEWQSALTLSARSVSYRSRRGGRHGVYLDTSIRNVGLKTLAAEICDS